MAIATENIPRCSDEDWEHFRWMCSHGMLFEVLEWIDAGKPTLRRVVKKASAFQHSIVNGNHSLVKTLWERAWQEEDEASKAVSKVDLCGSNEVFRYVVEAGCPLDRVKGYDLFTSTSPTTWSH